MKIHHLRNASFVIESGDKYILVDPMLGKKGIIPPFTIFRSKPKKNPTVDLPENADEILGKVTHCLITHLHPDHIDTKAVRFLKKNNIAVVCSSLDRKGLERRVLTIYLSLKYWKVQSFLGGNIIGVPAIHGYGFIKKLMGNVMGFYLELPDEKSIYISSDTVYTEDVDRAITELEPEIIVMAAGKAQFDFGQPLLMDEDDMIKLVSNAQGRVYANHMEAINHCQFSRADLKNLMKEHNLLDKVDIPEDGDVLTY